MQYPERQDRDFNEEARRYENRQQMKLPSIISGIEKETHNTTDSFSTRSEVRLTPFFSGHNMGSVSPIDPSHVSTDYYHASPSASVTSYPAAFNTSMMHNPKRAYRQRRKDPSCDACRERKVKCDATETASCTECSSRNVRCQFTKDTNRRMSSIKQVQDLERQLQEARAELNHLRAAEHSTNPQSHYSPSPSEFDLPDISRSPRKMLKARPPQDLSAARMQLSDLGCGLFKSPISPFQPDNLSRGAPPLSLLPPREVAQHSLNLYLECVHRRFPIVCWPQFCQNFWDLYSGEGGASIVRETMALYFAVLGVGAVFSPDDQTKEASEEFIRHTFSYLDLWTENVGIDQALATFLISIYLAEVNKRTASLFWLTSSIRIAQDKGLHLQGGNWSVVDGEMRKRIWYSFYIWDRFMAMELGRPMIINDDDCDTEYPTPFEDEMDESDPREAQNPTAILASIHVARLLGPLSRLCRSLCIPTESIRKFEAHLAGCLQLFPSQLQLRATEDLDPLALAPLLHFQNVRLLLHRHNVSPACSQEQRSSAISQCAATAQDTAKIISRCSRAAISTKEQEARLTAAASSLTCTHIWRCMLFLAFRGLWDSFHILLRYATLIGGTKRINVNCGHHLSLLLRGLAQRHQRGDIHSFEDDEELIVLVSGDLQAGTGSWVWGNAETGSPSNQRQKHTRTVPFSSESPGHIPLESGAAGEGELPLWCGWPKLSEAARWLEEAPKREQSDSMQESYQANLAADFVNSASRAASDQGTKTTRSRMTIASITHLSG